MSGNLFVKILKAYIEPIKYTLKHKVAYLKVEKQLTGKISLTGLMHDADKLFLYIFGIPQKTVHKMHRVFSSHHVRNGVVKNPQAAIIDWECARFTKPDKPLSARQFFEKTYPRVKGIRPVLDRWRI